MIDCPDDVNDNDTNKAALPFDDSISRLVQLERGMVSLQVILIYEMIQIQA